MPSRRPARSIAIVLSLLMTLTFISACVPEAPRPTPLLARVDGEGPQPTIAAPQLSQGAVDELTAIGSVSDFIIGVPVEVSIDGDFPKQGVELARTYAEAVPADASAVFMYWNDALGSWVAVPTEISDDRRTITATVHHLSWWTDVIGGTKSAVQQIVAGVENTGGAIAELGSLLGGAIDDVNDAIASAVAEGAEALHYTLGDIFTTRVDFPECDLSTPNWVIDVPISFEPNDPVLFCAGHDPQNPSLLVVKARANRGYGFPVELSVTPTWTYNSTAEANLTTLIHTVGSLDEVIGESVAELMNDGMFVGSGEEISFGIPRSQFRDFTEEFLVELPAPDSAQFLAGMIATSLFAWGIDQTSGYLGAFLMVARCVEGLNEVNDPTSASRSVLTCLSGLEEDIARQLAVLLLRSGLTEQAAGQLAGRIVGKASIALAFAPAVLSTLDHLNEIGLPRSARALTIDVIPSMGWDIDAGGVGPIRLGDQAATATRHLTNVEQVYFCTVGDGPDGESVTMFAGDGPIGGIVIWQNVEVASNSLMRFTEFDVGLGSREEALSVIPGVTRDVSSWYGSGNFYTATIDGTEFAFKAVDGVVYEIQIGFQWAYWECA